MAQEQIKGDTGALGSGGSLTTYTVPGSAIVTPYSVSVTFDGTGAGGDFLPCLTFKTITGAVIARCPAPEVASGGTAEISWFPRGGGLGGTNTQKLVGARIQATSHQTISNATNTDLVYQQVYFDTDNMANLGADARTLTVNTAGLYMVIAATVWDYNSPAAGRRLNTVLQNGYYSGAGVPNQFSVVDERPTIWETVSESSPAPRTTNQAVGLFSASVGDFFSSGVRQNSGGSVTCNGYEFAFLSAILLGAQ